MSDPSSDERFYALSGPSEGFFKDRGSKFYAFASPVLNIEEIDTHLQAIKKKYHDARHHCSAYRLGLKGEVVYSNDDGEPGNSAGPPILAAIRSQELTNVSIIVVRYFGGTKLGIRGLIEAYRTAAEEAILANKRIEIIAKTTFTLHYPYTQTSLVSQILHRFEVEEIEATYTDTCTVTYAIREENYSNLETRFVEVDINIKTME